MRGGGVRTVKLVPGCAWRGCDWKGNGQLMVILLIRGLEKAVTRSISSSFVRLFPPALPEITDLQHILHRKQEQGVDPAHSVRTGLR